MGEGTVRVLRLDVQPAPHHAVARVVIGSDAQHGSKVSLVGPEVARVSQVTSVDHAVQIACHDEVRV